MLSLQARLQERHTCQGTAVEEARKLGCSMLTHMELKQHHYTARPRQACCPMLSKAQPSRCASPEGVCSARPARRRRFTRSSHQGPVTVSSRPEASSQINGRCRVEERQVPTSSLASGRGLHPDFVACPQKGPKGRLTKRIRHSGALPPCRDPPAASCRSYRDLHRTQHPPPPRKHKQSLDTNRSPLHNQQHPEAKHQLACRVDLRHRGEKPQDPQDSCGPLSCVGLCFATLEDNRKTQFGDLRFWQSDAN